MHPWLTEMERLRARTAQPGLVDPKLAAGLCGLEFLQRIVRGEIPDPPITRTLDFTCSKSSRAARYFRACPRSRTTTRSRPCTAAGTARCSTRQWRARLQTLCEAGRAYTTLELKLHCVRALTARTGPVRAEGKVVASGRRVAAPKGGWSTPTAGSTRTGRRPASCSTCEA